MNVDFWMWNIAGGREEHRNLEEMHHDDGAGHARRVARWSGGGDHGPDWGRGLQQPRRHELGGWLI